MFAFFAAVTAMSTGEQITVLPWNGHKAAVSLTFDDGDPSHWRTAIPELNRRRLKATFFLIAGKIPDEPKWVGAAREGHEIGNHSMTHEHPGGFDAKRVADETAGAQGLLKSKFGGSVVSFAYPFAEITPQLKAAVADSHIGARGGWGPAFYLKPTDEPDWLDIPSQVTLKATPAATYLGWVDTAAKEGAWTVFMIHGIEGTPWGWEPVPKAVFIELLDRLRDPELWVAPFGQVCAYWRAEKIFEQAKLAIEGTGAVYRWAVPAHFPKGVKLQVRVGGAARRVSQAGKRLSRSLEGVCVIDFDAGMLRVDECGGLSVAVYADLGPPADFANTTPAQQVRRARPLCAGFHHQTWASSSIVKGRSSRCDPCSTSQYSPPDGIPSKPSGFPSATFTPSDFQPPSHTNSSYLPPVRSR